MKMSTSHAMDSAPGVSHATDIVLDSPQDAERHSTQDAERHSPQDAQRLSTQDAQRLSTQDAQRHSPQVAQRLSPQVAQRHNALQLALHEPLDALIASAENLRKKNFGSRIELCAIINTRSGNCTMDCHFCSQSRHNPTGVEVFDQLSEGEIRERLDALKDLPLSHVGLVTSGGALADDDIATLARTIQRLPDHWQGRVCGSLGRLDAHSLTTLRAAGLVRFHHNLETDEAYYPRVCTTQHWSERLATVYRAREANLSVCCGGLFGMGETWEHRVDFALRLRREGITEIPLNFLHAHAGTPLAKTPPLSPDEALRIVAVFRHILPQATLRVCGGRPGTLKDRQKDLFAAGANALMTGNYLTTSGSSVDTDLAMLTRLGLLVSA